jgi:hypothetical protein
MDFFQKAKNTAIKTKLRGDVALFEREVNTRKKKFGVELYDLMTNDKNKLLGMAAGTIFQNKQAEMKEPFDRARDDMGGIQARKDIKQKDMDVLEIKGAHSLPDNTAGEKVKKVGKSISDAGIHTKLRAEMALLDREMKIRKEQFGVEVFELTQASDEASSKKKRTSITDTVKNAMKDKEVSQQEKDIQACIDEAKTDITIVDGKIQSKQREINMLDEEMKPLVNE